jgi:hypothetical protein
LANWTPFWSEAALNKALVRSGRIKAVFITGGFYQVSYKRR